MECEPGLASSTSMSAGAEPCVPSSIDDGNELTTATNTLRALARQKGFVVHDVPGDGNCLYNAVAYQLKSVSISTSEMRDYCKPFREQCVYRDFLAQPIESDNVHSADTEAPSDEDAFIDTVHDPEEVQLRWERYIHRLRNGAWGDHVVIQGISNEFNVAINVLSSEHSNMVRIVPRCGQIGAASSTSEVTSLSVAVAVEKQQRFFCGQLNARCTTCRHFN